MSAYQDMIDSILSWAEFNPNFDTSFVVSLDEQLGRKGALSMKQVEALENIIERFHIQ